jgi:hypothetical protein
MCSGPGFRFGEADLYDLTRGLSTVTSKFGRSDPTIYSSGYLSVQDLTTYTFGDKFPRQDVCDRPNYSRYLQNLLVYEDLTWSVSSFSAILTDPPIAFMKDENSLLFLSRHVGKRPFILQHFAELHVRIMNYLYPRVPHEIALNVPSETPVYSDGNSIGTYFIATPQASLERGEHPSLGLNIRNVHLS